MGAGGLEAGHQAEEGHDFHRSHCQFIAIRAIGRPKRTGEVPCSLRTCSPAMNLCVGQAFQPAGSPGFRARRRLGRLESRPNWQTRISGLRASGSWPLSRSKRNRELPRQRPPGGGPRRRRGGFSRHFAGRQGYRLRQFGRVISGARRPPRPWPRRRPMGAHRAAEAVRRVAHNDHRCTGNGGSGRRVRPRP